MSTAKGILGILLVIGGFAQLTDAFTGFLSPGSESIVLTLLDVFGISEILFCLWLLIKGVKHPRPATSDFSLRP